MSKKRYRQRLTFKQQSTTVNSMNEVTGDEEKYDERWGSVTNGSGNETTFGEQMQHVGAVTIETTYPRSGRFPQAEDLITWVEWGTTRTVQIKHVQPLDESGRTISILCAEV